MIGNYTTKMIEEWETAINNHKVADDAEPSLRGVIDALKESVHWVLTPAAFELVHHTDIQGELLEGTRLPYDSMVVEYEYDYDITGKLRPPTTVREELVESAASKRIIHLTDIPQVKSFVLSSIYLQPEFVDSPVNWVLSPVAIAFPYECFNHVDKWYVKQVHKGGYDFHFNVPNAPMVIPSVEIFSKLISPENLEQIQPAVEDMITEIKIALGFLSILSCDNAPVTCIAPSEKLNKKRAKSGKPLLQEYRTLHLTNHTKRNSASNCTGGHASPAPHWRRGHIRNQPTAKGVVRKWIKPMIIGGGNPDKPEIVVT